jgi:enamine deaminase RidA (YjgF/YER057c/UK114 family)
MQNVFKCLFDYKRMNQANGVSSDERAAKIKAQATQIMQNFYGALATANVSLDKIGTRRTEQTRVPKINPADEDFKDRMLKNAPNTDGHSIIAEKKQW